MTKIRQALTSTVITLAAITVVTGAAALHFWPDTEAPPLPNGPSFAIRPGPEEEPNEKTRLLRKPISAEIKVARGEKREETCADFSASGPGIEDLKWWTLEIETDPRAYISSSKGMMLQTPPQAYSGQKHYTLLSSRFSQQKAGAELCWPKTPDTVIAKRGSNAAISMPGVWVDWSYNGSTDYHPFNTVNAPVSIRAELSENLGPDWAVDAGNAPEAQLSTPGTWVWKRTIGALDTRANGSTALLQVHSVSQAAEDHHHEFLSGILLGIAAAAAIVGVQEFVNELRKTRLPRAKQGG
ncbi:hypothetical protein ABZ419_25205 [Streptomyces cinnamoneus]|uniref:hypothetical protein n=1 Tax=Streptomyces cinnamoneus TaxID=53446 RepID=UPI0033E34B0F